MGTFNRNPEADTLLNLTPGDVAQLQKDAADMPFDVQLLVENVSTIAALGQDAHAAVTGPNIMVLAIDPVAGHVLTRFGKSTGVKPSDFDSISKAGNAHFHNHEWVAGIETVVIRAQASAQTSTGIAQSSAPVVVEHGLSGGTWLLIALLGAGFVGIIVWLYRRSQREGARREPAGDRGAGQPQRGRDDVALDDAKSATDGAVDAAGDEPAQRDAGAAPAFGTVDRAARDLLVGARGHATRRDDRGDAGARR